MLATRPQKISGWLARTVGPGVMPWMMNALNIIAIMLLDGMPSVSSGMNEDWAPALLAASGPATPSTAPSPNSDGFLEIFFSTE
ncbi:hypothetical protein D9M68_320000 [compost metagenome]